MDPFWAVNDSLVDMTWKHTQVIRCANKQAATCINIYTCSCYINKSSGRRYFQNFLHFLTFIYLVWGLGFFFTDFFHIFLQKAAGRSSAVLQTHWATYLRSMVGNYLFTLSEFKTSHRWGARLDEVTVYLHHKLNGTVALCSLHILLFLTFIFSWNWSPLSLSCLQLCLFLTVKSAYRHCWHFNCNQGYVELLTAVKIFANYRTKSLIAIMYYQDWYLSTTLQSLCLVS